MPYHQRIPHVIRFTVGKQWTSVQSLMPVHQTVEILQSEQKSWTVQQTELHTTCMANNHNSCISFHSWFTVAPLQPEAGSCLSRSPLSARLFGSGTVSANREGFFFSYKTWLKTYCFLLTNIQPIYCLILMQLINVLCFFNAVPGEVFTSWPISIAHSLADWSLASTITLNMVHNVGEMRKSVDLLLFVSLDSKAILVLQCKWNIHKHCNIKISARCSQHSGHSSISVFWENTPFDTVLDHVARHELYATLEVFGKLILWPVQVPDEGLESIQLPEEVLRRPGAVTVIDTHTHTHRSEDKGHPDEEREGGRGCVWGEGVCCGRCGGGGCCSSTPGHSPILFRPYTDCYVPNVCLISCLFGCFWTVSVWMQRSRRGFKCNKSITMLQSMIIDWKVKWPHAGKVTADTAANHTVSRQRSGGRGMEKWGRACKNKRKKKKRKKEHLWSTEWKRKKENLQIDFPSSQALSQHPSMSPGWWGPWKSYQTNHADLLGQPE